MAESSSPQPMVASAGITVYRRRDEKFDDLQSSLPSTEITLECTEVKKPKDETDTTGPTVQQPANGISPVSEQFQAEVIESKIIPELAANLNSTPQEVSKNSKRTDSKKDLGSSESGSESSSYYDVRPPKRDERIDVEEENGEKELLTDDGTEPQPAGPSSQPPSVHPVIITLTILSISGGIFSLGTDVLAVVKNYSLFEQSPEYLILGVTFLCLASVTSAVFNISWYRVEMKDKKNKRHYFDHDSACPNRSKSCKPYLRSFCCIGRFLASAITLGHTCRQIEAVRYAIMNRRAAKDCPCKKVNYTKSDHELDTAASLGAFEVFLEAVPTFVIQVSVILMEKELTVVRILSIVSSAVLLPYSIVKYNEATQSYKDDIDICPGLIFRKITHFLWKFFEIVPRMVAIAAFASVYGGWKLGLFISINSILMIIWVMCFQYRSEEDNKRIDPSKRIANLRLMIIGLGWNICFLNAQTGPTRNNKILYYIWVGLQNNAMAILYFYYSTNKEAWWHLPFVICIAGSSVLMLICMLIFYKCNHPKKRDIKTCLPKHYWCAICYDDPKKRERNQDTKSTKSLQDDEGSEDTQV